MAKKSLPLKQLIFLAIASFGIQFASSLQMANTSSVYKFLGVASSELPFLWLAAPVSGLIMQPLIGQLSDDTATRFGKRRPYLIGWGIICAMCFCLLPFSYNVLVAALLFWLAGCSINGCMESLRALTGDITPNQQKTSAFSWQTILAGVGAGIAAILPWLIELVFAKLKGITFYNEVPVSVQLTFIIGGFLLITCIAWACFTVKEKKPTHQELLKRRREQSRIHLIKKVYVLFYQIIHNIKKTPLVIRKFVMPQIFTWVATFTFWLYFSVALAQHVYGLPIGVNIMSNPHYEAILAKSAVDTGFYFSIYQFVSVIYAILLPKLTEKWPPKLIHGVSLIIGAISLILFSLIHYWLLIVLCMIGVGIMWGSITVLPYAIVTAELPHTKMGIYLGIFNITITLPQIVTGLILGPITAHVFHGHVIYAIALAGFSLLTGGFILVNQLYPLNFTLGKLLKKQWQN